MRNRAARGVTTVRVPCAERVDGQQLRLADGLDPAKGGWQLLFRGIGAKVRFNALPLTFMQGGKLVAQVIAVRAEGLDWYGCLVPEPAPRTPKEADERFGVVSGVGEVMQQIAGTPLLVTPRPNRAVRRQLAAEARKEPRGGACPPRSV